MKKLLIASIVMLATLTACQNSDSEIAMEDQQHQTFAGKTTARDGEEMSKEEQIAAEDALRFVMETQEKMAITDTGRKPPVINCHTPYNTYSGHACVFSGGYLFQVSWVYNEFGVDPETGATTINSDTFQYTAVSVHSCHC